MKVAVVGCGTMGRTHAKDYAEMPGVELAAVCDFNESTAKSLADKCQTAAYTSFDQMMREAEPDVVSICLPTGLHKEYVLRTAEFGKHVICEKPIAPTLSDAREMIDGCRAKGVRLFIGHVVRFFPNYRDIAGKIANGAIGEVGVAHTKRIGSHPGLAKSWYNDKKQSGGVIMDLMIHDIDFVRSVMGDVQTVFALNRRTESQDYALVTLRFKNGSMANLEGFWGYPGPFTTAVDISGKSGVIRFNSNQTSSVHIRKTKPADDSAASAVVAVPQSPAAHDPYYYELEHFLDCIRTGADPIVSAEDAYQAVAISLAALASAETGRPVDMDHFGLTGGNNSHV